MQQRQTPKKDWDVWYPRSMSTKELKELALIRYSYRGGLTEERSFYCCPKI
ncbi:MAG: hypothetical protein PUP92_29500 [Rhizonema sp. PD38]|nr:hypothetical protein [Rhizonema sp. PD38]